MSLLPIITKWPESSVADTTVVPLPLPSFEYSGQPRNGTIETKSSEIKIQRRQRFFQNYQMGSVEWVFTQTEYYAFLDLYNNDLGLGTAKFRLPIFYPTNDQLTEWVVRFMGDGFTNRWVDGAWQVDAVIELLTPYNVENSASLEDWQFYISHDDFEYHSHEDFAYEAKI
jgi:hypothetical protein